MAHQRRKTILDRRHGKPPSVKDLANIWRDDVIQKLLGYVWEAYDYVYANYLSQIPVDEDYDDLERSITELLEHNIQDNIDRYLSYRVQHESFERETRDVSPAQPPQYDIAFVWNRDPQIKWPLEAKIAKTDGNIAPYIKDIKEQFLTCRYAPFSNGGAMLCYLKRGSATKLLSNIEKRLGCTLSQYAGFPERPHKTSEHTRTVPTGKDYPVHFRCHHLIMPFVRHE